MLQRPRSVERRSADPFAGSKAMTARSTPAGHPYAWPVGFREAEVVVPAELALFLRRGQRPDSVRVRCDGVSSLGHVVESLGVPLTEVGGLIVNGARAGTAYRPGDALAGCVRARRGPGASVRRHTGQVRPAACPMDPVHGLQWPVVRGSQDRGGACAAAWHQAHLRRLRALWQLPEGLLARSPFRPVGRDRAGRPPGDWSAVTSAGPA